MKLTFFGPDSQGLEVPQSYRAGHLSLHGVFTHHSCRVKVSFNNKPIEYPTPIGREVFGCGLSRARAFLEARQRPDSARVRDGKF
jgi:hypothetical protein